MKTYILASDFHVPFVHKKNVKLLLRVIKALRPQGLVLNGDFFDFYGVSHFCRDPARQRSMGAELKAGLTLLREFETLVHERHFILGNHEDRHRKFVHTNAPQYHDILDFDQITGLGDRGWNVVPYREYLTIGDTVLMHDVDRSGKNVAQLTLSEMWSSAVCGHAHRSQQASEGGLDGKPKTVTYLGHLADVRQVDYANQAKLKKAWTAGFGVGYLDEKTRVFTVRPVNIHRGNCIVNGKQFSV